MSLQPPLSSPALSGHRGVMAALASAFLFGAGTPLAKSLLDQVSPWVLAGLLYAGSGLGLWLYRVVRGSPTPRLGRDDTRWMIAAVLCGGILAPVLLMFGLSGMPSSHAALLLNAEAVLTTLLAWAVFKESLGRRIVWGMVAIVAGALLLSWPVNSTPQGVQLASLWPALAVLLACALWALDNNFTRKVALNDASWIACVKGLVAGITNLALAWVTGAAWPELTRMPLTIPAAMLVGFLAYGVSLALFVVALRHLGASRAGAYFSVAPFVGALFSVLFLAEPVTWPLLVAASLMALGIWLHLTEHHTHGHDHEVLEHTHLHSHDAHHQHQPHDHPATTGPHSHPHRHEPMTHAHVHYPDAHHRHEHSH